MSSVVAVQVEGLSKQYGLPFSHALRRWWRRRTGSAGACDPDEGPWALSDVNLEVRRGETVGIIGRNGAGKSTLLKVLAGVTPPTRGRVSVVGRVSPMIEVNAGIHPELTGRENVRLLGTLLGLSRREMANRQAVIEEFTELGEWLDRPVRTYSTGMLARLGFGVAMNLDADVYLVDEVLAVGDLSFQRRCYAAMDEVRRRQAAILFVSHNLWQVQRICDRAILLERGRVAAAGDPLSVTSGYFEAAGRAESLLGPPEDLDQGEPAELALAGVRARGPAGDPVTGRALTLEVDLVARADITEPTVGLQITTLEGVPVTGASHRIADLSLAAGARARVRCHFPQLPLFPGAYALRVQIRGREGHVIQPTRTVAQFQVQTDPDHRELLREASGLVVLERQWSFEAIP